MDRDAGKMRITGLLAAGVLLAGCGPSAFNGKTATVRPPALRDAAVVRGGSVCPLDSIDGNPVRRAAHLGLGARVELAGWSTVADRVQPVPRLIHAVLRPDVAGQEDHFAALDRVRRPDVANGDPRLEYAGYRGRIDLPKQPGRYSLLIWSGDQARQIECATSVSFVLR